MRKFGVTLFAVVALLVAAPVAFAGSGSSSILNGYGKVAAQATKVTKAKPTKHAAGTVAAATTKPSKTLPFTGFDLGLVAGAGILIVMIGVAMRRIGRSTP